MEKSAVVLNTWQTRTAPEPTLCFCSAEAAALPLMSDRLPDPASSLSPSVRPSVRSMEPSVRTSSLSGQLSAIRSRSEHNCDERPKSCVVCGLCQSQSLRWFQHSQGLCSQEMMTGAPRLGASLACYCVCSMLGSGGSRPWPAQCGGPGNINHPINGDNYYHVKCLNSAWCVSVCTVGTDSQR